jgi:hypothetical protein
VRWYRRIPFPVFSLLASLAVGLILWASGITGEAPAIIAALGLELVITVHRILLRIEKDADPLYGLLRTAKIDEALSAAAAILHNRNSQAQALLEELVTTFCGRVKRLQASGIDLPPSEFMEIADRIFNSVKPGDRLHATSLVAGGAYWQKAYGQQYERLNRIGHARGLEIERIYILRNQGHLDEIREILDRQSLFSRIRIVLLDGHDDDNTLTVPRRDFFVYNNEVVAEFIFVEPTMTIEYIQVSTEPDRVREMAREYQRIRDNFSSQYSPSIAPGAR